ncbi:hypothetical protein [Rhodoplanes sp. SY1]|uniref:hypothetical protein n=1 Tax=Rhodoplanes sp. SY1 TaxID=3166646 RepID=UPI0038B6986A
MKSIKGPRRRRRIAEPAIDGAEAERYRIRRGEGMIPYRHDMETVVIWLKPELFNRYVNDLSLIPGRADQ